MYYQCFPTRGKARKDSKTFLFWQYLRQIILKISMINIDGQIFSKNI
jgi:hypothetical protein